MSLPFLVLPLVPCLFIRVPSWRALWHMEDRESRLAGDLGLGCLRNVRRRLIHPYYQLSSRMMPQPWPQEIHGLGRRDSFFVQPKEHLAAARDGRQRRYTTAFAGYALLRRWPTRCPRRAPKRCQRARGLVLKVHNGLVSSHRLANLRQLVAAPGLPLLLRPREGFAWRLGLGQAGRLPTTPQRLLRHRHVPLLGHDVDQPWRGPKVRLETKRRGRRQHEGGQGPALHRRQRAWPPGHRPPLQAALPCGGEARPPAVPSGPIGSRGPRHLGYGPALLNHSPDGTGPNSRGRRTHKLRRSCTQKEWLLQLRRLLAIAVLQNYWNGP